MWMLTKICIQGQIDDFHSFSTMRTFFDGRVSNLGGCFSPLALRVKASALFHHAHQLASNWDQRRRLDPACYLQPSDDYAALSLSNAFMDDFQTLEHTIACFHSTLIPVHQLDATVPNDKHGYITIHTLAHVAIIHLYYPLGHEDPAAYEKCLRAARCCVSITKSITEPDYELLDPILGVSLSLLCSDTRFIVLSLALLDGSHGHVDSRTQSDRNILAHCQ